VTTIDPRTLKPGDRIRYQREATVKGNFDGYLSLKSERVNGRPTEFRLEYENEDWVPTTFELLERPLPSQPAIGSVVIFHPTKERYLTQATVYQRFARSWQSTRVGGPDHYSWAEVLERHRGERLEVLTVTP
jgi:hypothetical protein